MAEESDPLDEHVAAAGAAPRPHRVRSRRRQLVEWGIVVAAAALTAVLLRAEVVQAFEIPSLSMYPTLHKGDRVLVNKLSYRLHDVHRGDIVVFERPPESGNDAPPAAEAQIKDLIKRVIALPGETVSSADGRVLVNGEAIAEPYLPAGTRSDIEGQTVVPKDQYWVMGDNRTQSKDSRFFGAIPKSSIVGRAFVRMWPLSHLGGL